MGRVEFMKPDVEPRPLLPWYHTSLLLNVSLAGRITLADESAQNLPKRQISAHSGPVQGVLEPSMPPSVRRSDRMGVFPTGCRPRA